MLPIKAFVQSFKDIFRPGISGVVWWPLLINIIIFFTLFSYGAYIVWTGLLGDTAPQGLFATAWYHVKQAFAMVVLVLGFVITGVIAALSASIIASPFNGLLSERTETTLYNSQFPTIPICKQIIHAFTREGQKIVYYLPRFIGVLLLALILGFIPVLNLLSPIIVFIFSAWVLALQYLDFASDNHAQPLSKLLTLMRQNRANVLLLGTLFALVSSVPIINLVMMPIFVISATRVHHQMCSHHQNKV